jgi:ribonuclease D
MVEELSRQQSIALDAEMDSYFVYHTKLCLVQISAGQTDYLVDTLALDDLSPLNEVTNDPSIRKVVHAGENDVPYFRGRGVTFVNLFDTHVAAKLLDLESKSLAGLVELYFGVSLSKDHQRSDWRLRPLPEEQIAYAREDTLHLNELADRLQEQLVQGGLQVEAEQAFASLERFEVRKKDWDPDGWAKIKGAKELTGSQRTALADLYGWRDQLAARHDLALFRVVGNGLLLALARKRFSDARDLQAWAKSPWISDNSSELIEILKRARDKGPIPFPELGRKRFGGLDPGEEELFERLRVWRNEESRRKEVPPERIFSNRQLKKIAKKQPRELRELKEVEGLEPWRADEFGPAVLALLQA